MSFVVNLAKLIIVFVSNVLCLIIGIGLGIELKKGKQMKIREELWGKREKKMEEYIKKLINTMLDSGKRDEYSQRQNDYCDGYEFALKELLTRMDNNGEA